MLSVSLTQKHHYVSFEDGTSDGVTRYTLPPRSQPDQNHQAHTVGEGGISVLRWSDGCKSHDHLLFDRSVMSH